MYDLDTWKTVGPPIGTVYNYSPRGDEQTSIAGAPARTEVGAQIYNQAINTVMMSKFTQGGEKLDDADQVGRKRTRSNAACLSGRDAAKRSVNRVRTRSASDDNGYATFFSASQKLHRWSVG